MHTRIKFWALCAALAAGAYSLGAVADDKAAGGKGVKENSQRFEGKIAKTYEESVEWWPEKEKLPPDTPNVLVINLDDVGYGHLGAYGGLIETPNLDSLANKGLRYANFHSHALCTPSRASLLTGRNHHRIGMGAHSLTAMGFPGYNAEVPPSAKSYAKHLAEAGFTNYALGKWDGVAAHEISITGPFDRWPSGEGFHQFYGLMAAETDNFRPVLWDGHSPTYPSKGPEDGYHLSEDLADKAIDYITAHVSVAPDRPFSMYWAPVGMHAPIQAPKEYIEAYRGRFDGGWDQAREKIYKKQLELGLLPDGTKLSERGTEIPAWSSLSADERKLYARQMEVFAGMLTHLDEQVGRMLVALERVGQLENTLILVTSDNGASGEGGLGGAHNESYPHNGLQAPFEKNMERYDVWGDPSTYPHYHAGWAWAGNTPFKHMKQLVHNGGAQVPMIIHWPKGIAAKGEIRHQYHHVVDVAATIFDVTGVSFYETLDGVPQMSLDGNSMAASFNDPHADTGRFEQYYELWGNRGIYRDGWKAVTAHNPRPWELARFDFEDDVWELYYIAEDFSESTDLADKHPEKLDELIKRWDELAWENNVYPLYDDVSDRIAKQDNRLHGDRKEFVYYAPGAVRIPEKVSPPVKRRSHSIATDLNLQGGEEGVILACGGLSGGYSLFIKDNELHYVYNSYNDEYYVLKSGTLPEGRVEVEFRLNQTAPRQGVGSLFINGDKKDEVGMTNLHTASFSLSETFDVGADYGSQVTTLYGKEGYFPYSGELDKVVVRMLD